MLYTVQKSKDNQVFLSFACLNYIVCFLIELTYEILFTSKYIQVLFIRFSVINQGLSASGSAGCLLTQSGKSRMMNYYYCIKIFSLT